MRWTMRRSMKRSMVLLVTSLFLLGQGCGSAGNPPPQTPPPPIPDVAPPDPANQGLILFDCQPTESRITVDGIAQGTAAAISTKHGLHLPRGLHRIEIGKEGFKTFRVELNLGEQPEVISVQLRAVDQGP
jgi:hypothetical protein